MFRTTVLLVLNGVWSFLFLQDDTSVVMESPEFTVPDAPPVPDIGEMVLQGPTSSLAELGLDTWWPAGLLRQLLDFMHVHFDIPWWGCIVGGKIATFFCHVKTDRLID